MVMARPRGRQNKAPNGATAREREKENKEWRTEQVNRIRSIFGFGQKIYFGQSKGIQIILNLSCNLKSDYAAVLLNCLQGLEICEVQSLSFIYRKGTHTHCVSFISKSHEPIATEINKWVGPHFMVGPLYLFQTYDWFYIFYGRDPHNIINTSVKLSLDTRA
jgi:hypothetical protein